MNHYVDIKVIIYSMYLVQKRASVRNPLLISGNTLMNNTHGALTHVCVCKHREGQREEKRRESEILMRNGPPLNSSPTDTD